MFEAALQTEAMLQGRLSTSLPASHPLQEDFGTLERPEEQDPRTVAEAARAFTSLRVHIPDSQQPGAPASPADLPGAVPSQPHSPKKRKAAGSLHHEESSMVSGSDAGNGGSDGEGELGVGREGSDGPGQAPLAGGTMGDLLHQFGQIELNRDLLEAIKRTESQTGAPRQWYDREVDRAAFDAAVSAAQAVLLQQLGELETELTGGKGGGSEEERRNIAADSVSELLQVYALPTIAVFAAEGENRKLIYAFKCPICVMTVNLCLDGCWQPAF